MNLFKSTTKSKTVKVTKVKEVITIEGEEFNNVITNYNTLKDKIKKLQLELLEADNYLRETGMNQMINQINNDNQNNTITLASETGESVMIVLMDKYKSINEARANELTEVYGDIIDTNTEYYFNNDVLERNKKIINDLITKSKKISNEDKANLIETSTNYSIKSGTINNIGTISQDTGIEIVQILDDIKPITQLR